MVRLDSPPIGELDKHKPALHLVDACLVLLLVIIDPEIEDCSWPEFVAEQKAGVDVLVIVVVVCDQTNG